MKTVIPFIRRAAHIGAHHGIQYPLSAVEQHSTGSNLMDIVLGGNLFHYLLMR